MWKIQCCGSGMFIPDPNFFYPGSKFFSILVPGSTSKNLSILTQKLFQISQIRVVHPGSGMGKNQDPVSKRHRILIRNTGKIRWYIWWGVSAMQGCAGLCVPRWIGPKGDSKHCLRDSLENFADSHKSRLLLAIVADSDSSRFTLFHPARQRVMIKPIIVFSWCVNLKAVLCIIRVSGSYFETRPMK